MGDGALSGSYELYGHDGYSLVHTLTFSYNMILSKSKKMLAVMSAYRRVGRYILLLHFILVLMAVYKHDIFTLSLLRLVQDSENLARNVCLHSSYKNVQHSTKIE